jgi:CheY-like chemotaxis protein
MIDLIDTVRAATKRLRDLLGDEVEIVFSSAAESAIVAAAPPEVERLLGILAANATSVMPAGGKLFVAISRTNVRDEFAALCLSVPVGDYVTLAVTDTGHGGTGVDLSGARRIVEGLGGAISEHRTPGIGTVVRAFFPTTAGTHTPEHLESESAPRGAETILLVEDEPAVRTYLAAILAEHGYEVLSADNSCAAVRIARTHAGAIDLLVTDMAVSGSSGAEIVSAIGKLRPGIAVLRISGHTGRGAGPGDTVLEKPFRPAVLLQRVRTLLDSAAGPPGAAGPERTPPSRPSAADRAEEDPGKE